MTPGPPDPSQGSGLEGRIRDVIYSVLSDPMGYPDQMVAWFNDQITIQLPTTNSTTGVDVTPPGI